LIVQAGQTVPYTRQGGFYDWNSNSRSIQTNRQTQFSADVTYEMPSVTLHSISAYLDARGSAFNYSPAQPAIEGQGGANLSNPQVPVKTFSQELQLLSSSSSAFNWIVGAYFATSKTGYDPLDFYRAQFIEKVVTRSADARTDTYAGFAQATIALAASTNLTGGLRYTHDKLSTSQFFTGRQTSTGASAINTAGVISNLVPEQSVSYDNVSYRASLDHHFTRDIMVFASLNTGYKAGGYNVGSMCAVSTVGTCPAASIAPPVRPEKLTSYEIGLKSELFDRMVRFNASAFHYDYRDLQVQSLVGSGSTFVPILNNAARARINGIDVDVQVAPSRYLLLNGAFEVLDAKFRDFPNFVPMIPRTVAPFGNLSGAPINAAGQDLPRAPRFAGNLGATVTLPVGDDEVRINTNYSYNGGFYWDPSNRLRQNAYGLLNAEIGYTFDSRYTAKLWGRNITGTKYYTFADATAFGDRGRVGAPATYGVTINYKM